ncbi:MAG: (2Fe-2S)-binding protein [Opitutaceae bacterium]
MSQKEPHFPGAGKVSRRHFIKGLGTAAVTTATLGAESVAEQLGQVNQEKVHGPGAVPIRLQVNGDTIDLELEPRVTLLDALRNHTPHTGSKEVCDRGTCGACTVLIDGTPVYACMTLAIEAQGRAITTVEGLAQGGELTRVQQAFIDSDGLMCGYCTPGFLMSVTALLEKNPHPSEQDVRKACSGNTCRCGTYPRVFAAALEAAGVKTASKSTVVKLEHLT